MLAEYLSRYKVIYSLVFTILFSLGNLIWESNSVAKTMSRATEAIDFFTQTLDTLGKGFSRLADSYASYQSVKAERDLLQEKLLASQDLQFKLESLESENERLRSALALPAQTEYPSLLAEVISQDPDNWFRSIIINKGSQDGVEPYMPVVAYQGMPQLGAQGEVKSVLTRAVVGKVIQVNNHTARVLPLADQYSRLGVFLKKSGHWAMLLGQSPQHELPRLDFVSLSIFLNPGDEIVTSGGDGVFPRGILVGYVEKDITRLGSFQQALVRPALDFKKLDTVVVIKKKREDLAGSFAPIGSLVDEE